jgi:hypothetical protein
MNIHFASIWFNYEYFRAHATFDICKTRLKLLPASVDETYIPARAQYFARRYINLKQFR